MSKSLRSNQPLDPLTVGNVVSASLRIYRDHFKLYYGLAFIGYLWVLVPVYGWAKFSAMMGLISRLAFGEVTERPETLQEARRYTNSRMWDFLVAGFLVSLIWTGVLFGVLLVFGILIGIISVILAPSLQNNAPVFVPLLVLLGIIAGIGLIFGFIWLFSRLSIVELPLAIEDRIDSVSAISRSWSLTQGFVLRLQLIFFVAFLITLPFYSINQIFSFALELLPKDSPSSTLLYIALALLNMVLSFVLGALLIPFWQAIKAVIYYDLRSRKEGFGLQLRNTEDSSDPGMFR
jgi:hypothetical protein